MDNYNVLVLMQKDAETNMLTETIDSYTMREGMELIESVYMKEEDEPFVYLTLTTADVEDWQYYGIYDLYNEDIFGDLADELLDGSGEFNPRWIIKLKYVEERLDMEDRLNQIVKLHNEELQRIMPLVEQNKEKYQSEAEAEE